MKKKACLFLVLLLMLSLLGGCYKTDTAVKIDANGGVDVTSIMLAPKETYDTAGTLYADYLKSQYEAMGMDTSTMQLDAAMTAVTPSVFINQMQSLQEQYGGEIISLDQIDQNGNVMESNAAMPEDGSMIGTRIVMHYDSVQDLESGIMNAYPATDYLFAGKDDQGLKIEEKRTLFGAVYKVSGKYSLSKSFSYEELYKGASQDIKDKISGATAQLSFAFPLGFSKSNADEKNLLGNKLTWIATADAPDKDVYFEVTTINPLVFALILLVIILLVLVILLAMKKKKDEEPDDYFVDEEGNLIPIYDTDEEDISDEEEIEDEVAEEPAVEETEETEETEE